MNITRIIKISFFLTLILVLFVYYLNFSNKKKTQEITTSEIEDIKSSNLLNDLNFSSEDSKGNLYSLKAEEGEIDFEDNKIIFLKKINAVITLKNTEKIFISSDYGKYNTENSDTIFSKNVNILYLDNKIKSEYLEFSIVKNLISISKGVSLSNQNYTIKADVIEMNLNTKKVEIFMYEGLKKVKIKSIK